MYLSCPPVSRSWINSRPRGCSGVALSHLSGSGAHNTRVLSHTSGYKKGGGVWSCNRTRALPQKTKTIRGARAHRQNASAEQRTAGFCKPAQSLPMIHFRLATLLSTLCFCVLCFSNGTTDGCVTASIHPSIHPPFCTSERAHPGNQSSHCCTCAF